VTLVYEVTTMLRLPNIANYWSFKGFLDEAAVGNRALTDA
jgi:hypothetical protein